MAPDNGVILEVIEARTVRLPTLVPVGEALRVLPPPSPITPAPDVMVGPALSLACPEGDTVRIDVGVRVGGKVESDVGEEEPLPPPAPIPPIEEPGGEEEGLKEAVGVPELVA